MDSVTHSRLLKFVLPSIETYEIKMAKPLYKIKTLNPNIESQVPGSQTFKEPSVEDVDKGELPGDNFVQVLKVTKNETALTKDDFKLQKDVVNNPLYSQVFSDVIKGPHPQRAEEKPKNRRDVPTTAQDNNTQNADVKKGATKIPILNKFKQTADKIQEDRGKSKENVVKESSQSDIDSPRRTSIPKLRRMKKKIPKANNIEDSNKSEVKNENVLESSEENRKPDDEFEKIFEEIVNNQVVAELDETVLPDPKIDPDKLESSFAEIIHAYDENNLETQNIENKNNDKTHRSKIPISRTQSNEEKKPKTIDRSNSLQNSPCIEEEKVKIKSIDFYKPTYKPTYGEDNKDENQNSKFMNNVNLEENKFTEIHQTENEYSSIDLKKGDPNPYDQNNERKSVNEFDKKKEILSTKMESFKTEKNFDNVNTSNDVEFFNDKVNRLVSRLNSGDDSIVRGNKKELPIDHVPKKKLILSQIALFERKEPPLETKTKKKESLNSSIKTDVSLFRKPKIIEEVLKSHMRKQEEDNEDVITIIPKNQTHTEIEEAEGTYYHVILEDNSAKFEKATPKIIEKSAESNDFNDNKQKNLENDVAEAQNINFVTESDIEMTPDIENAVQKKIKPEFGVEKQYYQEINQIYDVSIKEKPNNVHALETNNLTKETSYIDIFTEKENDLKKQVNVNKLLKNQEFTSRVNTVKEKQNHRYEKPQERIIENRLRRLQSISDLDESKLKRSKSIVDIELGDTVKGKVHYLIENLKLEKQEAVKKDVINIKERPRRKSVQEKIALFERKFTAVAMENETTPPTTNDKPLHRETTTNANNKNVHIQEMIEDLTNAKKTYGSVKSMPVINLSNGQKMPVLAVGTALLDPQLIKHIIGAAIDLGYRAIDTAYIYGTEELVGEAIRLKIEDGTVKREDLFVTSKLWSTFHRPDLVEKACKDSLKIMGLDYFDLYMIHNPMSFKEGGDPIPTIANVIQFSEYDFIDAWYAMETLVRKGLVKSIGLSNFNSQQVARVFEKAQIKPVVNQVECHPYLNQERLSNFCAKYDVRISCFGILGSGGTPAEFKAPGVTAVIDDPFVKVMASGMHISAARLLIRYQLERGHAVVVKCSSAKRLWDNLQALECKLSQREMEALQSLNKNKRNFSFKGMGDTHKNYPFKAPF